MNTAQLQSSIFDTIDGLPIHPLAVHVAVVFLPLSAMALALLVFVPRWRKTYLPLTLIGLTIATVFTFISRESGEALADRVGEPQTHEELGGILFPAAVGLLAVGVAFYFLQKSDKPKWMVQTTAGVAIAAVLSVSGLTYFVGHTGAQATWEKRIGPTASPTPTPTPTDTTGTGLTVAQVATHNKATDCWTIIKSDVYDLTSYIQQHPGGAGVLTNLCGKDATSAFESQHASQMAPASALAALKIGRIGEVSTTTPTPTPTPTKTTPKPTSKSDTAAQVATHKTGSDCWSIINKKVYNLTSYVSSHPGGASAIQALCGKDATSAFTGQHGGESSPTNVLASFKLGTLSGANTLDIAQGEEEEED
jgi:cytochrome b involved in lipid metabolism